MISIKNPQSGTIHVREVGDIIMDDEDAGQDWSYAQLSYHVTYGRSGQHGCAYDTVWLEDSGENNTVGSGR